MKIDLFLVLATNSRWSIFILKYNSDKGVIKTVKIVATRDVIPPTSPNAFNSP